MTSAWCQVTTELLLKKGTKKEGTRRPPLLITRYSVLSPYHFPLVGELITPASTSTPNMPPDRAS